MWGLVASSSQKHELLICTVTNLLIFTWFGENAFKHVWQKNQRNIWTAVFSLVKKWSVKHKQWSVWSGEPSESRILHIHPSCRWKTSGSSLHTWASFCRSGEQQLIKRPLWKCGARLRRLNGADEFPRRKWLKRVPSLLASSSPSSHVAGGGPTFLIHTEIKPHFVLRTQTMDL